MAFLTPPPRPPHFHASLGPPPPQASALPPLPTRRRRQPIAAVRLPNPFPLAPRKALLSKVEIVGRKSLPDSVVEAAFNPLADRRVTAKELAAAIETCNTWYTSNGYPCSRLHPVQSPGVFHHTLTVVAIEPSLTAFKIVSVDKDGKLIRDAPPPSTRRQTVLNALGLRIGDIFQWTPDGFGRLMALAIFEYADAEVAQLDKDSVELTLRVRERPSCRVEPGVGMTSDGRVYGDLSLVDNNLFGRAQRLQLDWQKRLELSRASGGLVFEDARVGARIPVSFRARAYRNSNSSRGVPRGRVRRVMPVIAGQDVRISRPADGGDDGSLRFEKDRDGAMVELSYRPGGGNLQLSVAPAAERVLPNVAERAAGIAPVLQAVWQTSVAHITRLPVDLPNFGHLARVESLVGRQLADGGNTFQKVTVRVSQYFKVAKQASVAVAGTLEVGSDNLPWHEQKSLGGPANVRGYNYGELGRYKSFGLGRVELRIPLTKVGGADGEGEGAEVENVEGEEGGPATRAKRGAPKDAEGSGKGGAANGLDEKSKRSTGNLVSPKMFDNLPALTGVLFADAALGGFDEREPAGASYGLGLRVGGVISVDWTRTLDGRKSRLHFGLVDRNL